MLRNLTKREKIYLTRFKRRMEKEYREGLLVKFDRGYMHRTATLLLPYNTTLGELSTVGRYCILVGEVNIGDYTIIAPHVYLWAGNHSINPTMLIRTQPIEAKKIVVGDDVWIASMGFVTAGVTIHDHAVVGAGAVVTHNVPEWEIWAGVPARKIGDRRTWKKS